MVAKFARERNSYRHQFHVQCEANEKFNEENKKAIIKVIKRAEESCARVIAEQKHQICVLTEEINHLKEKANVCGDKKHDKLLTDYNNLVKQIKILNGLTIQSDRVISSTDPTIIATTSTNNNAVARENGLVANIHSSTMIDANIPTHRRQLAVAEASRTAASAKPKRKSIDTKKKRSI